MMPGWRRALLAALAVGAASAAILLSSGSSLADTIDDEIDYLVGSIGKDKCAFIRNGKRYSTRDARAYLRSKKRRNAHHVRSTEDFIDKIASMSVTSGEPYLIKCRGADKQPLGNWLTELLADYRQK